jgi:hypothetical protein
MDENEIKAVSEALEQLRQGGTVSAETLAKLGGTTQSTNKALEAYTKKILGAGMAVGGMAKTVADGEGSFKSLGGAISGLTGVVGKLAGALPLVGGAAKALAEGVGEAAKFVLDQLDIMAKNYQTLGDASAVAEDGLDGLMRQFNAMGNYSLPAFTKAVKANTLGLSALSGSAAAGAEELSKVSGSLTTGDTARKFLKLGIGLDAVGDATAQYLADAARYGITQGSTTEQLTKKTQDYIIEVDKIARLTGQTREQQAKEAQKSLVDARFRAKLAEMTANGQQEQADQLRLYVDGLGGAAGDAARALVTGIPLTKEAAEANLFTGDALRQNTQSIISGQKRASQAIVETQDAMSQGADTFGTLAQYGKDLGGLTVQALDQQAVIRKENKSAAQRIADAEASQKKTSEAAGQLTEDFTDAQLATANSAKNLQSLGFSLAKAAVPAVKLFAETLDKATGYINQKFGLGGRVPTRPTEGKESTSPVKDKKALLDIIGKGESGGNYNALVYGKDGANTAKEADLTNMTIAQVQEYQKGMMARGHASTAVGKYQMIAKTLEAQVKKAGLDPTKTKFDQRTQDLLAGQLVDQAGFGKKSDSAVMRNLAGTWASLPKDMSGRGAYDGYNQNKAVIDPRDLQTALSGPTNRYQSSMDNVSQPSAGVATQAQGQQSAETEKAMSSNNRMYTQLAELNANQRRLIAINEKILQRQS